MKKFILLTFLLVSSSYYSQQTLDYIVIDKSYILKPTWDNLVKVLFSSQSEFASMMSKYNYKLTTDKTEYTASNGVGTPLYIVNKGSGEARFYSQKDNGFTREFRNDLKNHVASPLQPKFSGGYECYYISYSYEGINYRIEVLIREDSYGGSTIGFILR